MKSKHPFIIGIDTQKATHVAVAINTQGIRFAALSIPTNPKGYMELERWSRSLGQALAFGIEGTGSYGAGLTRYLLAQDYAFVEVTRPNRQLRYTHANQIALMLKERPDLFFLGKQRHSPRHKPCPPK